jgi:Baseplate J-like protein
MTTQTEYTELDLMMDSDQLTLYSIDYMEVAIPGWVSRPGGPETIMMEANGQMASEVIEQASGVPDDAMTYLGTSVYGLPMDDGASASGAATIEFTPDTPATKVPQGAEVVVPHPSGATYLFGVDRDVFAPEGGGEVSGFNVVAAEIGSAQNGCFGLGDFQESYDGVNKITVNTTIGGRDEEDALTYMGRFSVYLSVLNGRPILPVDHSQRALLNPRVGRAVALNLYQPATSEGGYGLPRDASSHTNVERCVTTVITADGGAAPPDDLLLEVYEDLDANREVNFLVYVISPGQNGVYTSIDVKAEIHPYPGVTNADAIQQAIDQMNLWMDPEQWGLVPGATSHVEWATDDRVRLYEAVDWLNRASGIHWVQNVALKKSADPGWTVGDIVLGGAVPMPSPGPNMTFTVV